MDKYIHVTGKRNKESVSNESAPEKKFKKAMSRQNNDSYLKFGFT